METVNSESMMYDQQIKEKYPWDFQQVNHGIVDIFEKKRDTVNCVVERKRTERFFEEEEVQQMELEHEEEILKQLRRLREVQQIDEYGKHIRL